MVFAADSKKPLRQKYVKIRRRRVLPECVLKDTRPTAIVIQEDNLAELHFTSAPDRNEPYDVGERVEVLCDHNQHGERVHDWLEGVVVQVDAKMLAVQFQENVYLTDGWMVPDHVLWYPKNSRSVRTMQSRRSKARSSSRARVK